MSVIDLAAPVEGFAEFSVAIGGLAEQIAFLSRATRCLSRAAVAVLSSRRVASDYQYATGRPLAGSARTKRLRKKRMAALPPLDTLRRLVDRRREALAVERGWNPDGPRGRVVMFNQQLRENGDRLALQRARITEKRDALVRSLESALVVRSLES